MLYEGIGLEGTTQNSQKTSATDTKVRFGSLIDDSVDLKSASKSIKDYRDAIDTMSLDSRRSKLSQTSSVSSTVNLPPALWGAEVAGIKGGEHIVNHLKNMILTA
jgi:hypothetical protein